MGECLGGGHVSAFVQWDAGEREGGRDGAAEICSRMVYISVGVRTYQFITRCGAVRQLKSKPVPNFTATLLTGERLRVPR